jgi:DNA end-binding protein Ku
MATTVWKGQLGFGLVSVPVRLYRAARKERIRLHYLAPSEPQNELADSWMPPGGSALPIQADREIDSSEHEGESQKVEPAIPVSRINQTVERQNDRQPVSRNDLMRGYEVSPDRYVTFAQHELRALHLETSSEMNIVRSVRLAEIDPVYFETSYYVIPDKGGERGYSLLFLALKQSRYVALATVVMHGREHVVVIRPAEKGLLAHTMSYQDEVRADNQFEARVSDVVPQELLLARTFVEAIAGPFAPEEFKDAHRPKLQDLITAKLKRGEVALAGPSAKSAAPIVDIMDALKKSIESRRTRTPIEPSVARREPGREAALKGKPRKRRA